SRAASRCTSSRRGSCPRCRRPAGPTTSATGSRTSGRPSCGRRTGCSTRSGRSRACRRPRPACVRPALFDMPRMDEPATGEIFSLPDAGEPSVNQIFLVRGRLPGVGRRDEAVVLQSFADAHGLEIGDTVSATVYGGRETLSVVGIALSPEHVYAIAPGQIVPDDRLFGVLWMRRGVLADAVNQDGAFNEAVVRLAYGANEAAVVAALDALLEPYGAAGAYGRKDHISDAFISSEIEQLETMGRVLPPIFLLVAAFLVNVVIS